MRGGSFVHVLEITLTYPLCSLLFSTFMPNFLNIKICVLGMIPLHNSYFPKSTKNGAICACIADLKHILSSLRTYSRS